jgi:hydroxyacylglutathione hydrolase
MPLEVDQFPCLDDNYGFLCRDAQSGQAACIDTPDAGAILARAEMLGWTISLILNTHWHPDHAGGNAALKAATGAVIAAPEEVRQISPIDRVIRGGDAVALGGTVFGVIDVGGHTLGHVAFHSQADGILFAGDTLFPMGCGRIFEGSAEQMWKSLCRLRALPPATTVYSAHEYTLANARFTLEHEASEAVVQRVSQVEQARAEGRPTVPTTIELERQTNPFFRADMLMVRQGAKDPVESFAMLRSAKDHFKG